MTKRTTTRIPLVLCSLLIAGALGGCPAGDESHDGHDDSTHEKGADHDDHDHANDKDGHK